MEKINKKVENDEQGLKDLRDRLIASSYVCSVLFSHVLLLMLNREKVDADFFASFKTWYTLSRPAQPHTQTVKGKERATSPADCFALLYSQSKELISHANRIVEKFEKANEKTIAIVTPGLLKNDWARDNETAETLLAVGHRVGLERFEAVLKGESAPVVEEDDVMFAEAIYGEEAENDEKRITWGKSVKKHERATRKTWKALLQPPVVVI